MSAPSSFDRVLSALRRLFPFEVTITRPAGVAPAAGDSAIGRELATIAWMLARATDRVEVFPDELFASTATESIARWEKVFGTASNVAADIDTRRARVLSIMRRTGGTQPDRLRRMLYAVLGLDDPDDIELIEMERSDVENGLLVDSGAVTFGLPSSIAVNKPWPSTVDASGVRLYLQFDGYNPAAPSSVTVTSPQGTTWTFDQAAMATWYQNTTSFGPPTPRVAGERAGGRWTFSATANGSSTQILRYKWLVSNKVDSGQIYNFYAFRDPALPGTPDLQEAQRLFNRSALAHMSSYVIQSIAFVVGDPYSLVGRDPVGD